MIFDDREQTARPPGLVGAPMTLPDAHWGYGFPIGGVAAFDPEQGGIVSAGGVGFDISCGIRCLRGDLDSSDLLPWLSRLGEALFDSIPAGVGEEGSLCPRDLDVVMPEGARWSPNAPDSCAASRCCDRNSASRGKNTS